MIICNGSPKTGTHLLCRTVSLFGGDALSISHQHKEYESSFNSDDFHIHIVRSPRNAIISYIRHFDNRVGLTEANIIKHIPIVINEMSQYVGWLKHPNVLTVKFEKLLTTLSELTRISRYIKQPVVLNHFNKMWGRTATFTGDLSNWKEHWTKPIDKAYRKNGGVKLEKILGYNPSKDVFIRKADDL